MSLKDLHLFHLHLNPTLTNAAKDNLKLLFDELEKEEPISEDIANKIIEDCYKREIARQIAQAALDISEGRGEDFEEIQELLQGYAPNSSNSETIRETPEALQDVLSLASNNTKWDFNIKTLSAHVKGVGPGLFTVIAARPEVGKTAFWSSLCASPGGFAHQGAIVLVLANEEPAHRVRLRLWSAVTGMTELELATHQEEAKELYKPIAGRIKLYDVVGFPLSKIPPLIELHKPDIVVVDQLDKVRVDGDYARGDERLREIYTLSREIAKRYGIAMLGISQLSAEAQDKVYPDFSMLENSKTGKAAEADLIICIGTNQQMGNGRTLNIPKNKISGDHTAVTCQIIPALSRYVE